MFGLGLGHIFIYLVVGLCFVFWLTMLIDCLKNEPSTGNDRVVWLLVIIFLQILGAALYYFIRRPQRA